MMKRNYYQQYDFKILQFYDYYCFFKKIYILYFLQTIEESAAVIDAAQKILHCLNVIVSHDAQLKVLLFNFFLKKKMNKFFLHTHYLKGKYFNYNGSMLQSFTKY